MPQEGSIWTVSWYAMTGWRDERLLFTSFLPFTREIRMDSIQVCKDGWRWRDERMGATSENYMDSVYGKQRQILEYSCVN